MDDLDENWMGVGIESLCFVKEMGERDELIRGKLSAVGLGILWWWWWQLRM